MVKIRISRAGKQVGKQGFTLLELLVVLAIVGFTLSLIPGFIIHDGSSVTLNRAVRVLVEGLRDARSRATLENRESVFVVDVERRQFQVGPTSIPEQISGEIALQLVTARSEQSGMTSGRIRFFPDGSSSGGRIAVSRDGIRQEVNVDWLTGDISVGHDGH